VSCRQALADLDEITADIAQDAGFDAARDHNAIIFEPE